MSSKWLYTLPAILILLRLLKSRPRPSRETIVKPEDERVLLLGASSGVGRDLALAYAKRGARICLFARRAEELERVRVECMAVYGQHSTQAFSGSDAEGRILVSVGDVTDESALIEVRDTIVAQPDWKGLDTVHILAGVPSTSTLLDLAGVTLAPVQQGQTSNVRNSNKRFDIVPLDHSTRRSGPASARGPPDEEGLARLAKEARACAEVNYVGTVLALGCFVPLLASTSISPALHHLSSVAATIPAPCRAIYSATKAAGLMAMESCRIECEGSGVRFFSLLPGTIANDFRLKTATSGTGGRDETRLNIKHSWDKLLLAPEKVVDTILYHLALPPNPAPLIPYPPFNWFRSLDQPPCATFYLPFMYRAARWMGDTPLGWGYVEPNARKKYGLPN